MTGKELKEWVAAIPDQAVIEVRQGSRLAWREDFVIRAVSGGPTEPWNIRAYENNKAL